MGRLREALARFFSVFTGQKHFTWLLIILYGMVNGLVAVNSMLHNPLVGYDMDNHLQYVLSLAQGRFPTPQESNEYFSPPLPYLLPAWAASFEKVSPWRALKYGQWLNVLLSLGLTYTLLKICDVIRPGAQGFKAATLGLLGMLPVYYKTFAQTRGEPWVAFFAAVSVYQILTLFKINSFSGLGLWLRTLTLGVSLGLLVLSRQWGFFLFPAFALFVGVLALKQKKPALLGILLTSFGVAFLVAGWFYLYLFRHYGSFTAFNRQPMSFSLANQPPSFYFGFDFNTLFLDPVRPTLRNQLWSILYADTWGDYWGYFLIVNKDARSEQRGDGILYLSGAALEEAYAAQPPPEWLVTNRPTMSAFLGRVNRLALFPSLLFVLGMMLGVWGMAKFTLQKNASLVDSVRALFAIIIILSLMGYLWFLIRYPSPETGGNTIKASYLLHLYPFLALLSGDMLHTAAERSRPVVGGMYLALVVVFFHNLPVLVTRYAQWSTHLIKVFHLGD